MSETPVFYPNHYREVWEKLNTKYPHIEITGCPVFEIDNERFEVTSRRNAFAIPHDQFKSLSEESMHELAIENLIEEMVDWYDKQLNFKKHELYFHSFLYVGAIVSPITYDIEHRFMTRCSYRLITENSNES